MTDIEDRPIYQRAWDGMLPQAADEFAAYARTYGWHTEVSWGREEETGKPRVVLSVGRLKDSGRRSGPRWVYRMTWVCRADAEQPNKLLRYITAITPEKSRTHGGPSLAVLRAVIRANPVPRRRPR